MSWPSSVVRSRTMLRLERLSISNGGLTPRSQPSIRPNRRPGSPRGGSILMTSAPQSARMPPVAGPATQTPSSTTLMPATGPAMATFLLRGPDAIDNWVKRGPRAELGRRAFMHDDDPLAPFEALLGDVPN